MRGVSRLVAARKVLAGLGQVRDSGLWDSSLGWLGTWNPSLTTPGRSGFVRTRPTGNWVSFALPLWSPKDGHFDRLPQLIQCRSTAFSFLKWDAFDLVMSLSLRGLAPREGCRSMSLGDKSLFAFSHPVGFITLNLFWGLVPL